VDASNPASSDLPRRLWVFDRNSLQEGEVLLELGESLKSRMIARLDGGRFSHPLIWAGNSDFVEAVSGGVRNIAYMRVLIQRPDNDRPFLRPARYPGGIVEGL
jgi:hypothetical protein